MNAILRPVMLFAVSLLVSVAAGQEEYMGLKTTSQAGAPLQVAGAMFSDTALTVLLVNVSGRAVEQVTMGVVLSDGASVVSSVTRTGIACRATVPPDGFLVVKEANAGFDKAASYFREKAITRKEAALGLTHVRFADGSEWAYALEANGHFGEEADQAIKDKVHALTQKQFPDKDMSWAFPGQGHEGKVSTCRQ